MKFKDLLVKYRTQNNLTQRDLAAITGIAQPTINRYENGSNEPKFSTGIKLLNAVQANLNELINIPPEGRAKIYSEDLESKYNIDFEDGYYSIGINNYPNVIIELPELIFSSLITIVCNEADEEIDDYMKKVHTRIFTHSLIQLFVHALKEKVKSKDNNAEQFISDVEDLIFFLSTSNREDEQSELATPKIFRLER